MAEQRFIIEHADGRQYSVTRAGFDELYKDEGFVIVGAEGEVELAEPAKPKRSARNIESDEGVEPAADPAS